MRFLSFCIFSLLLTLSLSTCHSQKNIYFNPDSTTSLEVICTHDKLDINGNSERLKWLIFQQLSPASFILSSDTCITQDFQGNIFSVITNTTNTFNYTYFSVVAIDSACNRSIPHFSTDHSAAFGGWILVPDNTIPSSPDTLRLKL